MYKYAICYGTQDRPDNPGQRKLYRIQPPLEYLAPSTSVLGKFNPMTTEWVIAEATWVSEKKSELTGLYPAQSSGQLKSTYLIAEEKVWDCDLPLLRMGYRIVQTIGTQNED